MRQAGKRKAGIVKKIALILVNLLFPGLGTVFMDTRRKQGIIQLILTGLAFLLAASVIGAILGLVLIMISFVWAFLSGVTWDDPNWG